MEDRTRDPSEPVGVHGTAHTPDDPRVGEMERPVELPDSGRVIEDRRHPQRTSRREQDRGPYLAQLRALFWAVLGSVVILYLFFVALDAIDPREVREISIGVLVLAVLWLGHAWMRTWTTGGGSRSDRERRGF